MIEKEIKECNIFDETRELADEFLSLDRVRCKKMFDVP